MDSARKEWLQQRHAQQLAFCITLDAEPSGLIQSRIVGGWLPDYAERTLRLAGALLAEQGHNEKAFLTLMAATTRGDEAWREALIQAGLAHISGRWQSLTNCEEYTPECWQRHKYQMWFEAFEFVGQTAGEVHNPYAGEEIIRRFKAGYVAGFGGTA